MAKLYFVIVLFMCLCAVNCGNSRRKTDNVARTSRLEHDADRIVFPDMFDNAGSNRNLKPISKNNSIIQLPLELAKRFNDLDDIEVFFNDYVSNKDEYFTNNPNILLARFGSDSKGRSTSLSLAKAANCIPEMTVVSLLPENQNVNSFYIPTCTRVLRCGGCCNNHLLSCQPEEVIQKQFKIIEMYMKQNSPYYKKYTNVTIEEHLKCKCDCRVKESDCIGNQAYNGNECRCVCKDLDAEIRCAEKSDSYWDPSTCTCRCIRVRECSTGSYFNHNSCNCKRR